MNQKYFQALPLLALIYCSIWGDLADAAPQTLTYQYDALGRLTTVDDNVNGDRSYQYDAAGNRVAVVDGSSSASSSISSSASSSSGASSSSSHPLICPTHPNAPWQCNTPNPTSYGHWAYCNYLCAQ